MKILARYPRLLLALVAAWLLYAFFAYLPALAPELPLRSIDYHLRRAGAYDVLLVLWFAAAAYCAGRRFLRLLGVSAAAGAEETAFSIAAGVALFSWVTAGLAVVGGLYRPVGYALLALPTAIWHVEMKELPGRLWRALVARLRGASWSARALGQGLLAAYVAVVLGVVLLSALGPSFEYDDLTYHLAGPKSFVQHHRLVPLPDVPFVFFPKNIEMLYTLGLLWHSDVTAKLVHFLLGVSAMAAVYGFSARFLSRAAGTIAVAVLAASPLFVWEMKTAHNDVGLALYVFVSVYTTAIWLWTGQAPWLRLAVLFLAFSLGAKYWALLALGVICSLVFAVRLRQSGKVLPAAGSALRLALGSALGLLPWGLVNLYYTGNPLFPLLNDLFRSPYWTRAHTEMMLEEIHGGGIRITLSNCWELFALWWRMMADQGASFGGNIGPFYVMLLPLLVLGPRVPPELWFLLASSVLYYAGWAVSGPWTRFLLPALPGFAAAAGAAAVNWLRLLGAFHRAVAITAATLLGALAVLASPFFESYGASSRYGIGLIETLPFRYLAGLERRSDVLARHYPGYRAVQYLNGIHGPKKVLYVHTLPDGFYLDGQAAFHYSPYAPGLNGQSADDVHRVLRQNGITHLFVAQVDQHASPLSSRESDFTRRYLRKLFQKNAIIVYELLAGPVEQDVVAYDFLDHLEEARLKMKQAGRSGGASREVRVIGDDSRYAMVTVLPAEVEFAVRMPERAVLGFALGKANPACAEKGSFQVWISSPEGDRRMVYRRDLEGEVGWCEERVDLAEYAGRRVTIAFGTEETSPCCDYLWADPVLISRSGAAASGGLARGGALEDGNGSPDLDPVVSGGNVTPANVRIGGAFEVTFFGPALPPRTYFDVRVQAPGSAVDEVVFNFQDAASARHTVAPSNRAGTWIITGVRAHRDPSDHRGDFDAVWIALDVTR